MGKKNSKLKQETIEELIRDTYCKFSSLFFVLLLMFFLDALASLDFKLSVTESYFFRSYLQIVSQ